MLNRTGRTVRPRPTGRICIPGRIQCGGPGPDGGHSHVGEHQGERGQTLSKAHRAGVALASRNASQRPAVASVGPLPGRGARVRRRDSIARPGSSSGMFERWLRQPAFKCAAQPKTSRFVAFAVANSPRPIVTSDARRGIVGLFAAHTTSPRSSSLRGQAGPQGSGGSMAPRSTPLPALEPAALRRRCPQQADCRSDGTCVPPNSKTRPRGVSELPMTNNKTSPHALGGHALLMGFEGPSYAPAVAEAPTPPYFRGGGAGALGLRRGRS
jgi:hypothetical protein